MYATTEWPFLYLSLSTLTTVHVDVDDPLLMTYALNCYFTLATSALKLYANSHCIAKTLLYGLRVPCWYHTTIVTIGDVYTVHTVKIYMVAQLSSYYTNVDHTLLCRFKICSERLDERIIPLIRMFHIIQWSYHR